RFYQYPCLIRNVVTCHHLFPVLKTVQMIILSICIKGHSLVLRCGNNTTEAYLATDEYLGGGDYTKVTFRIDKQNAITENWVMGGSNDTAFAPIPVKFIKKIYGKQNIIIGYKPYGKTQIIAEFKINHINEVAKKVSEACGWKL
ncbi:hypothetical protein KKJ26_18360, partial [Xenorhabdus bovienii]|nr:hypothetical protein [Xenorhabdus bovienii]